MAEVIIERMSADSAPIQIGTKLLVAVGECSAFDAAEFECVVEEVHGKPQGFYASLFPANEDLIYARLADGSGPCFPIRSSLLSSCDPKNKWLKRTHGLLSQLCST